MSLFRVDEACNGWTLDESEKASNRDAVKSDAEVRRRRGDGGELWIMT